jgi:endonuclease YncB( thermonuclease family)
MWLHPHLNSLWRHRFGAALPWVFVIGVAVGAVFPFRHHLPLPGRQDSRDVSWAGGPGSRHRVEVLRTLDGDTFVARIRLPDRSLVTRVRLRGIDAPELRAACDRELRMAEVATRSLRALLDQGEVVIFNVGPDKYAGRIVADAATARTPSVSAALLASGQVRPYDGGHRAGWCGGSWWN